MSAGPTHTAASFGRPEATGRLVFYNIYTITFFRSRGQRSGEGGAWWAWCTGPLKHVTGTLSAGSPRVSCFHVACPCLAAGADSQHLWLCWAEALPRASSLVHRQIPFITLCRHCIFQKIAGLCTCSYFVPPHPFPNSICSLYICCSFTIFQTFLLLFYFVALFCDQ